MFQCVTHVEAEFADVVPCKDPRRCLLDVNPHTTCADGEEYSSGSGFALVASQPVQMGVERSLEHNRILDVLELCLLPGEAMVVSVLRREHAENVRVDAHLIMKSRYKNILLNRLKFLRKKMKLDCSESNKGQ